MERLSNLPGPQSWELAFESTQRGPQSVSNSYSKAQLLLSAPSFSPPAKKTIPFLGPPSIVSSHSYPRGRGATLASSLTPRLGPGTEQGLRESSWFEMGLSVRNLVLIFCKMVNKVGTWSGRFDT